MYSIVNLSCTFLIVADPRVGSHPQELEDVDSGEQVMFIAELDSG